MKEKIYAMRIEQLNARAAEIDGMELCTLSTDELTQLDEERQLISCRGENLTLFSRNCCISVDKWSHNTTHCFNTKC